MAHESGTVFGPLVKLPKDPSACWVWIGGAHANGHGKKTHNGKDVLAHRYVWECLFGPIPIGLVVSHDCRNNLCVNPHHLILRTQSDNCQAGEGAKLVIADVVEIRRQLDDGEFPDTIAKRAGVSRSTVMDIKRRKSWAKAKPFFRSVKCPNLA
jgi:hypothetical protein